MCLQDLKTEAQYRSRNKREGSSGLETLIDKTLIGICVRGKCSDANWQVALINKLKKEYHMAQEEHRCGIR